MKRSALLAVTVCGSAAFGGLVYLLMPRIETAVPGGAHVPGSRFIGNYQGGDRSLRLDERGTYTVYTESGEFSLLERGQWGVEGPSLWLSPEVGPARTLLVHGPDASWTLQDGATQYAQFQEICQYGSE